MSTYQHCKDADDGEEVKKFSELLIAAVPELEMLKRVRIDFVFAYGDRDDDGRLTGDAIKHRGFRAYGMCSIVNLKNRAKGNGDAEILLDHDYWEEISEAQKRALVDHEMMHIQVCLTKNGAMKTDDLGRPKLKMRKHDIEVGWFTGVAKRHGVNSMEQIQAAAILDQSGQYLWPQLVVDGVQVSRKSLAHKEREE